MKIRAVMEVILVFSLTLLLVVLVGLSPAGAWQRRITHRPFLEYLVMMAVPFVVLLATRTRPATWGLTLRNARYHLDIAGTAIVPVALSGACLVLVDFTRPAGAFIMSVVKIATLFAVAWLLKNKSTHDGGGPTGAVLFVVVSQMSGGFAFNQAAVSVVFYLFFLGLGEEVLFRGYIQSRLNTALGRPFRFFGVRWGWGVVLASLLFGLMHVLSLGSLVTGGWHPQWWWGLWTFFGGLVLGFVREKSGSIAAPTILHGLPQAIAAAFGLV